MDNTNRKLIKACIEYGLTLRNDILRGRYLDGELWHQCNQWIETTTEELATIRKDYARTFAKQNSLTLYSRSESASVMIATKITTAIKALENMLMSRYPTDEVTFSLKTPDGIMKPDLKLTFDGIDILFDTDTPQDRIKLRKGLGKDILMTYFTDFDQQHKFREQDFTKKTGYNPKNMPKAFNRLQNSWATAFQCSREVINTLIFRKDGYIHITENIRKGW